MLTLIFLAGVYISRAGVAAFAPHPAATNPAIDRKPSWLLLGGMLVLAVSALGLGWLLQGRLEPFLGLSEAPHVAFFWTLLAVAASVGGLVLGGWRVWRHGAAPAFGTFPAAWAGSLDSLTRAPAALVQQVAVAIERLESSFDALARRVATGGAV